MIDTCDLHYRDRNFRAGMFPADEAVNLIIKSKDESQTKAWLELGVTEKEVSHMIG
jgi:hypothetical protein